MLKKRTNGAPEPPPTTYSPGPISTAEQKTIIGEHITIEGIIRGNGNLVIEGSVKGNIDLENHQLSVGPKGKVEAEINAGNVIVSGHVNGNIKALGRVQITRDADFSGEIKAKGISIEDGAYLKAVIELEREKPRKDMPVIDAVDKSSSMNKGPADISVVAEKGK